MGRRITMEQSACFIAAMLFAGTALATTSCSNALYTAAKNETAAYNAAEIKMYYPNRACIDKTSILSIYFGESMDPTTLSYSGSLSTNIKTYSWASKDSANDVLILYPENEWQRDDTLGQVTGSLYINAKNLEGWPCSTIAWTPEILDGVVYVDTTNGYDSDTNGGSEDSPFKSLKYAMRAIDNIYTDGTTVKSTTAEIRMAGGSYSSETDVSCIYITSPLTIKGGYKPGDWTINDPSLYRTTILGEKNNAMATITIDNDVTVTLENLLINTSQNDADSENPTALVIYNSLTSTLNIKNCTLDSECASGYKDYYITSIVSKGPLSVDSSTIILAANEDVTAIGISATSDATITNSTFTISDHTTVNENDVFGILGRSTLIATGNTISLSCLAGTSSYTSMYGLSILTPAASASKNVIANNNITLSGVSASATGIRAENTGNFVIAKNCVNNKARDGYCQGIQLSACSNLNLYDNAVHGGEGDHSYAIVLYNTAGSSVINNTIFLGSSGGGDGGVATGISVYTCADVSSIKGNIIYSDNRYSYSSFTRIGIYVSTTTTTISDLSYNVFSSLSSFLQITNGQSYTSSDSGLSSLNTAYKSTNWYYSSSADLNLTDSTDTSSSLILRPTSNTPSDITQSTLDSVPEATDRAGNERTNLYSIGAYEYN
jgi:hypothetical protein